MLKVASDAISASPYGLGPDRVRTPSTINALPGSKPRAARGAGRGAGVLREVVEEGWAVRRAARRGA
jgi:hypothetical protein